MSTVEGLQFDHEVEGRFVKYVSVTLKRFSSRWKRNQQSRFYREPPILNASVRDRESGAENLDFVASESASAEDEFLHLGKLVDSIENPYLFGALQCLTNRQAFVLERLVLDGIPQQSLARQLKVTQQAVNRTKTQALRRLRSALQGGAEHG